jgi:hypothetical protein
MKLILFGPPSSLDSSPDMFKLNELIDARTVAAPDQRQHGSTWTN